MSGIDWLPTICALTGTKVEVPDLDGEDVSKSWLGGEHARTKPLFWKVSNPRADVGIRDGQWKFHWPQRKKGEPELYDLDADPTESKNVAAGRPEIVKALEAKVKAWNATLPTAYEKTDDKDD